MQDLDPIYVSARRVLIDTLMVLVAHRESLVVIGAQAVYLHTGDGDLAVAPFTTDTDIAVDPSLLAMTPAIEALLSAAGFVHHPEEPGIWLSPGEFSVPVDLIVPQTLSPAKTRRSAPMPGHAKNSLRKARGIEAVLVDYAEMTVASLDAADPRSVRVKVAGVASLFVAKAHKIGERSERPNRLKDKDALDLFRLMLNFPASQVAATISELLLTDSRSQEITVEALRYLDVCFRAPASTGTQMAIRALEGMVPPSRVAAVMNPYVRVLSSLIEN
jgi:hypothetical protein